MKKEKRKISIYNEKIQLIDASSIEEAIKLLFVIYFNSNRINSKNVSVTLEMIQTYFINVHLDFGRKSIVTLPVGKQ
ncbi:unnamed protein product [Callosobruchus maculatus]|uniref:Uncharacterized protein n=1 Tax=Callosobruchus maculatus TaxID=64391 RepID=A0A653D0X0_CALMS|nr:unnamed protein product [Callosobruchus maculatus]